MIVNWNGKLNTLECLESVAAVDQNNMTLLTVVVDNGSTDGSVAQIKRKFPRVSVLETAKNMGFSKGNNIGINHALSQKSDFVWLLNNDTVVHRRALQELVKVFEGTNSGIAGSKIFFYPKREFHSNRYKDKDRGHVLWYAGGVIDWANMYASHRGVDEVDVGQYDQAQETDFVSGCSMFIRAQVLTKVGLLDEKYYLYLEDVDYCLRAQKQGFKLLYVPGALVWHKNAGSTDRPGNALHQYYLTRNRILVGMKFAPFRTKLALIKESFGVLRNGSAIQQRAIKDALLLKFGGTYQWQEN